MSELIACHHKVLGRLHHIWEASMCTPCQDRSTDDVSKKSQRKMLEVFHSRTEPSASCVQRDGVQHHRQKSKREQEGTEVSADLQVDHTPKSDKHPCDHRFTKHPHTPQNIPLKLLWSSTEYFVLFWQVLTPEQIPTQAHPE